jgi:hypothetical protein
MLLADRIHVKIPIDKKLVIRDVTEGRDIIKSFKKAIVAFVY